MKKSQLKLIISEIVEQVKLLCLKESISPKSAAVIEKWRKELGDRKTGVKLIDYVLERKLGLSSADLADTTIFANGLDAIEELLKEGNYASAINQAIETAKEMIEDEGGAGIFEAAYTLQKDNKEGKQICQKCKGLGHYPTKVKNLGTLDYNDSIVPCDFPGCHGGMVDREENRRAQGLIPHGPNCGCNVKEGDEAMPPENALYVEYVKSMKGEKPFVLQGERFEYCWARYPNGKIDVGVYAFRGDLVYGLKAFRQRYNIK